MASTLRGAAIIIVLLQGCVSTTSVTCEDGRVCPVGRVCDVANGGCIVQAQLDACAGLADNVDCTSGEVGRCLNGVCIGATCGDGIVRGLEECDGSDLGSAVDCREVDFYEPAVLGCTSTCTYDISGCTTRCGDGVKNGTEDCDGNDLGVATCVDLGFYNDGGLMCTSFCTFDAAACTGKCQDGIPNGGEFCDGTRPTDSCIDYGFEAGTLTCSPFCTPGFDQCQGIGWDRSSAVNRAFWSMWGASDNDVFAGSSVGQIYRWNGSSWTQMATPGLIGYVNGLWGAGPSDVFAATTGGQLAHWNGSAWSITTTMSGVSFRAMSGIASNDVWAVGDSTVARWNGATWTSMTVPGSYLYSVHMVASDNVWVGCDGELLRWTGSDWTVVMNDMADRVSAVWASGPNDVWAAGSNGLMIHWDGTTATSVMLGTWSFLTGISGSGPADIYVVGDGWNNSSALVFHYDGVAWQMINVPTQDYLYSVWTSPTGATFAGGQFEIYRGRGNAWTGDTIQVGMDLNDVGGTGPSEVFAVGYNGFALRFDGSTWRRTATPTTQELDAVSGRFAVGWRTVLRWNGTAWDKLDPGFNDVRDVYSSAPNDAFVWGPGAIRRWDGALWSDFVLPAGWTTVTGLWGTATDAWAVRGTSEVAHWTGSWTTTTVGTANWNRVWGAGSDVWIAAGTAVQHWDANQWTPLATSPVVATFLWASSPSDVWVSNGASSSRWSGASWSTIAASPSGLRGLWGSGPTRLFGVGDGLGISHYEGTQWYSDLAPPTTVTSGWMTATDEVYAVQPSGVWHFNGLLWARVSAPAGATSVWTSGRDDVHLVGAGGIAHHWNGTSWSSPATQTTNNLMSVSGAGVNDAWAVGTGGLIRRWNGSTWAIESSPTPNNLLDVFVVDTDTAFAVGVQRILEWNGLTWETVASPTVNFTAFWASGPDDVYAVGNLGAIWHWNGTQWGQQVSGTALDLKAVWGSGPNDVFMRGTGSLGLEVYFHYDGTTWSPIAPAPDSVFDTVFGAGQTVFLGSGIHRGRTW